LPFGLAGGNEESIGGNLKRSASRSGEDADQAAFASRYAGDKASLGECEGSPKLALLRRYFVDWQHLLSMANGKDGYSLFFYPVDYPVIAVDQLPYILITDFRYQPTALGECFEVAHFAEDGVYPGFRGGRIVPRYVLCYLGDSLHCERRPEDLHFLIRFNTAALASPCSMPSPPSI